MLNRVILIGRLTRDIDLRYTQQGTAVTTFTLAVNRKFNRDEADFIDCVAWRKTAENMAQYVGKGALVAVEGRIQVRNYQDKEGRKRWATEVVSDDVRFLESRKNGGSTQKAAGDVTGWEDLGTEVSLDDVDLPL